MQNLGFGLGIDAGQTIVENQNRRIDHQGARQSGALFLAAGEGHAALADDRVHALRKNFQVTVQFSDLDGAGEFFLGITFPAEGKIRL